MYKEHYNLTAMPFQMTPDFHFFFASREHTRAISHLIYGLAQNEGFVVITGEIGAGKTMLVERLWSQIDTKKFIASRILTTQITGDDLLRMIADGFGLAGRPAGKADLIRGLTGLFTNVLSSGKRCLLVIDEAQNLGFEALEELRMLSNFTVSGQAPFQCVLLGQPQFRELLADPRLEQLKQRVLAAYHLGPLSESETCEYVQHRLKTAGWTTNPVIEEAAFAAIHHHTGGIPRRINNLCSRVLLAGYLDQLHQISAPMVDAVAEEMHRDIAAESVTPTASHRNGAIAAQSLEQRVACVETILAAHTRTIKQVLGMAIELIEKDGLR